MTRKPRKSTPPPSSDRPAQALDLQRAQLAALAEQAARAAGQALGHAPQAAPPYLLSPETAAQELQLLRDQLSALASQMIRTTPPQGPAPGSAGEVEIALLRDQLSALAFLLPTGSGGTGSAEEVALLRSQLSALATLALGGTAPRAEGAELLLLRDQLLAISDLAAGSRGLPSGGAVSGATAELALLRAQLQTLAPLLGATPSQGLTLPTPAPTPRVPPTASVLASQEEMRLLRETLARLMAELAEAGAAPTPAVAQPRPMPPAPGMAEIEAAVAGLLQELVAETDRRIRAEREAMQARALLRHHGLDSSPPPARLPVAPRRL